MITFLFNITAGASWMAETDSSGLTLTLISVGVVFSALIVLYCVYRLSGDIFTGKFKRKKEADAAVQAAIAAAVHLYLSEGETSDGVHDVEPGVITLRRKESDWTNKALSFRKLPR